MLVYNPCGGENGPVTVAAFKAADSALRGSNGGFDSHTPPPQIVNVYAVIRDILKLVCRIRAKVYEVQVDRMALSKAFWRSGIHFE